MDVLVEVSDRMMPGHIAMPNGMGLEYPDEDGNLIRQWCTFPWIFPDEFVNSRLGHHQHVAGGNPDR